MKITAHISFYYIESRLQYLNRIIYETNKYNHPTDIFIHTNYNYIFPSSLHPYTNGTLQFVHHDLSGIHPFKLTWKCRELMQKQKNEYDAFMYIEDDILVPSAAIEYWVERHELLVAQRYNLGFVRIETSKTNEECITDLDGVPFDTVIDVSGAPYVVNNKNPYCAFWIYDKKEFNEFVKSSLYTINNIVGYETRESSAIGLHGLNTPWYKHTILPLHEGKLIETCKIYHMPNNYVNWHPRFAKIKFKEAVRLAR